VDPWIHSPRDWSQDGLGEDPEMDLWTMPIALIIVLVDMRKPLQIRIAFAPNRHSKDVLQHAYECVVPIVRRRVRTTAEQMPPPATSINERVVHDAEKKCR
jgi:hypothetical protein